MRRQFLAMAAAVLMVGSFAVPSFGQFGYSPLMEAIVDEDLYNLRAALLSGANPNQRKGDGTPAIVEAARAEKYPREMVQLLLQQQARPDEADREGNTALVVATRREHRPLINVLLYFKADPDLAGESGQVPLMIAIDRQNVEIIQQLIDGGADVNATDYTGRTPLAIAREGRNRKIIELIEAAGGTY